MSVHVRLYRLSRGFVPLGLTWLALALRLHRLSYQSLWRDEVDTLRFATRSLPDLLRTFGKPGENGPLFFLSMRPWLALAGQSEFALRFPSALAGALAVVILYTLVQRLAGREPALVAALLAATAPYLVWYGQEGKMYAALTVLVPLSLWLTVAVAQKGKGSPRLQGQGWRWVLLYVVTTFSIYTHVLAALVVPVQFLWLVIVPAGNRLRRRLLVATAYLGALVLPYLPMVWWQAKLWLSPTFETGHPFVPFLTILQVLAATYAAGIMPVYSPIILLPFLLALLAGIGLQRRPESFGQWRPAILLLIWLFLPLLAVYGVSLGMPLFADRYLIWAMPAALALMALGVVALGRVWPPLGWVTLSAMVILNLVAVRAQTAQPIKADFRATAQFVLAHRRPDDVLMFQIPYARYSFAYYLARLTGSPATNPFDPSSVLDIAWLDGPYTNSGMSESALAERMARDTIRADAVWLIASEAPLWDARGLAHAWLEEHGSVTDHADFTRISATRYDLSR